MTMRRLLLTASLTLLPALLYADGLDPKKLLQPPTDSWPSYNGDYTGRRFSPLKKINQSNVKSMTLAWVYRGNTSTGRGEGGGSVSIKATPLVVNGIMYVTVPDHTWAIDARTGRELWHYAWESDGGIHIGNRGVGVYGNWVYFNRLPQLSMGKAEVARGATSQLYGSSALGGTIQLFPRPVQERTFDVRAQAYKRIEEALKKMDVRFADGRLPVLSNA